MLLATTSLAAEGRGPVALEEHQEIVTAIKERDGEDVCTAANVHLTQASVTCLKHDANALA